GDQPRFEIQPRREIQIGMARPGEAINAAVLATAVGVDGTIETDIGRTVVVDSRARALEANLGSLCRRRLLPLPAIGNLLVAEGGKAVGRVAASDAPGRRYRPIMLHGQPPRYCV